MQNSNPSDIKTFQLGKEFILKIRETAIEKVIPEKDYLEITNQDMVKRLLKPPGGEQRVVTLFLKKGEISETMTLKESPARTEETTGLALTNWHGYLIILKDADAFGGTVTLEVVTATEQ